MKIGSFFKTHGISVFSAFAALCLGLFLGNCFPLREDLPENIPSEQADPAGNMGVKSILPETRVLWRYRFLACGHELSEVGGADLTGYTLEDITAAYPDCRVTEMDREHACIERRIEEYCPAHYVLVWTGEETLSVFQTGKSTLVSTELMQLSVEPSTLDEALLEPLRTGLAFDSLQEIDAYLEDAES